MMAPGGRPPSHSVNIFIRPITPIVVGGAGTGEWLKGLLLKGANGHSCRI